MKKTLDSIKDITSAKRNLKPIGAESHRKFTQVGSKDHFCMQTNQKNCSERARLQQKSGQQRLPNPLLKYWSNTKEEMLDIRWNKYWPRTKMMKLAKVQEERAKSAKKRQTSTRISTAPDAKQLLAAFTEADPRRKGPNPETNRRLDVDGTTGVGSRAAQDKLNALADLKANCDPKGIKTGTRVQQSRRAAGAGQQMRQEPNAE
ncbi:Hypothetical_protein [Hexamita inflata]|uniref:Hypothetical_protein n=1 Tax=Hexamita inflata TaxID=28002 RepID=A0AA86V040_9EUKA|nr:Hypothetical protein HINF_LOCUS58637 [Hexamita inflata]